MRSYKTVLCMALAVAIVTVVGTRAVAQDIRSQIVASSVLEVIKKRGALRVGLTSFVPWSMRDKKGELIGFEIDVSQAACQRNGHGGGIRARPISPVLSQRCSVASSTPSSRAWRSHRSETFL